MSVVDHPSSASSTELQQPSYAPVPAARRVPKGRKRLVAVLVGAAALIAAGFSLRSAGLLDRVLGVEPDNRNLYVVRPVDLSITLTESGELKPVASVEVKCEMDGRNTIIFIVEESSSVKKGELLVEFASDEIRESILSEQTNLSRIRSDLEAARQDLSIQLNKNQSDIEKAESDVEIAKLDLKRYEKGEFQQKLKGVELDIKQAMLDIDIKKDELAKSKKLFDKKYATKTEIRELEFGLVRAEAALEKYTLAKEILNKYEDPRDRMEKQTALNQAKQEFVRVKEQAHSRKKQGEAKVKDVEARVGLSQAKFDRLNGELEHCKVFSPADGVVQYGGGEGGHWRDDDRIAAGVSVRKGQTLLYLPDTSKMMVTTRIHEADRHMVQPGLPCLIKVPAVPGSSFHGRLTKVSQYADSANRWMNPDLKEHTAEILMEATDAPVSPGDTAEVTLLIGELQDVLAVPVISVFSRGARSFVFLKKGGDAKPIEVKTGQSNTTMVEITAGLSQGDRILRFAGDELTALLPKAEVVAPTVGMPPMRGARPAAARGMGAGRTEAGHAGTERPDGDRKNQAALGNGAGKGRPSGARPRGQGRRGGGSERKSGGGGSERKGGGG